MSWRSSQYPTLKVSIAFATSDPMTASPSWTDVTSDVRGVRIRRGRTDETQRFSPGTCSVTLNNRDRQYDPQYASATYVGNLYPMRQLKVEAVWNSTTYPMFRGFIEGWPQSYNESNKDAVVELVANDAFELLSNCELPSLSGFLHGIGTPVFWYKLDDTDSGEFARTAIEATRADHGVYSYDDVTSFVDFGQPGLVEPGSSAHVEGGAAVILSAGTKPYLLDGKVYTLGLVFSVNGNPTGEAPLIDSTGDYVAASTRVTITTTGTVGFSVQAGAASASITGTTVVTDGKPHSVVVTRNGTALALWVDGVADGTATMGANSYGAGNYLQLGNYITTYASGSGTYASGVSALDGNLQHFVAYASDLGSTLAARLGGWLIGWGTEGSSTRVGHLLDIVGWPSGLRSLDADGVDVGNQTLGGSALSALQQVEVSEYGRLFVDRSGNVAFHTRTHDVTSAAPTYTFGTTDSATSVQVFAGSTSFRFDRNLVANIVTVTGQNVEQTAASSSSIAVYGSRSRSISTLLTTTNDCIGLAEYIRDAMLSIGSVLRSDGFEVRPARAPSTAWPIVLGLEIGDKVVLSRTPQGLGAAITLNMTVASIEHQLKQNGEWTVRLAGTPYDPTSWHASAWVLGTGTLGTSTRLYG